MSEYNSYAEYLAHPKFRRVVDVARVRSGGRCEGCGKTRKTEPHHIVYCEWGKFDVPENLQMLCRSCHNEAHTCDGCGEVVLTSEHIKTDRKTCFNCYCHSQS